MAYAFQAAVPTSWLLWAWWKSRGQRQRGQLPPGDTATRAA